MRALLSHTGMLAFLTLLSGGCSYQPPYPNNAASYRTTPPPAQRVIQPPPEDYSDVRTLNVAIETDPPGADVYTMGYESSEPDLRLGTSPMDIRISFCEHDGVVWFKYPPGAMDKGWFRAEMEEGILLFLYFCGRDIYDAGIFTLILTSPDGRRLSTADGDVALTDGCRIRPLAFPIRLVKHGRVFAAQMANAMNSGDYYGAEELRLRRISELQSLSEAIKKFASIMTVPELGNLRQLGIAGALLVKHDVEGELIASEIDQLKHTVGLLDPQLMAIRKQLLAKLQAGDIDAALALAQAVSAMERRYFPEPEQPSAIAQAQTPATQDNVTVQGNQTAQAPARQEIVIQQKPCYGAANIVEALGAMRGSKLDPEAYQKALGGAQLLDIMGLGSLINK